MKRPGTKLLRWQQDSIRFSTQRSAATPKNLDPPSRRHAAIPNNLRDQIITIKGPQSLSSLSSPMSSVSSWQEKASASIAARQATGPQTAIWQRDRHPIDPNRHLGPPE